MKRCVFTPTPAAQLETGESRSCSFLLISSKLSPQPSSRAPSAKPGGRGVAVRWGGERPAAGFSARLSRAASPRRCNYYVSSGAYSPGVFNLVLFVSQRDPHLFSGEEREATPGLKLINQPGFAFRRPPARRLLDCSLAARSRHAPVEESVSDANVLGEPSERTGNRSEYADTSPDALNALSPELPLLQPPHTPKSLGGPTSSLAGLLDEGDFGSLSSRC